MGRYHEPTPVSLDDTTSRIARGIAVERKGAFVQIPVTDLNFTTSPVYRIKWCQIVNTRFGIMALPNNTDVRIEDLIVEYGDPGDYVVQHNDGTLSIVQEDQYGFMIK